MSAEDGLADTVRPRLDAAGADVTQVHAIEGVPIIDESGEVTLRPPTLADVLGLEEAIIRTGAVLLIVDVIMAYLPNGTRTVIETRTSDASCLGWQVSPIRRAAQCFSSGTSTRRRAAAIGAVDPWQRGGRPRRHARCRRSGRPRTPGARVGQVEPGTGAGIPGVSTCQRGERGVARVQWEGRTEHTARTLLADYGNDGDDDDRREVDDWLTAYLQEDGGAANARDVIRDGKLAALRRRYQKGPKAAEGRRNPGMGSARAPRSSGPSVRP